MWCRRPVSQGDDAGGVDAVVADRVVESGLRLIEGKHVNHS
jgi:hypothetical protein